MQKYFIALISLFLCLTLGGCDQSSTKEQQSLQVQTLLQNFKAKFNTSQNTHRQLQKITVKYLDYQGQDQTGEVEVIEGYQSQVRRLFTTLYNANFHLSAVKTLASFNNDISQAFSANATFTLTQGNDLFVFLNPVTNPVVLKNSAATSANSNGYNVIIVPPQGLFSVNHSRTGQPNGATNQAIVNLLQEIGVNQVLTQDEGNILYYGLFKFNGAESNASLATSQTADSLKKAATEANNAITKNSATIDGFSFGPLPNDVRQYLIDHNTWNSQCPVSLDRLSYLKLKYYDYNGAVQNGNLIVADVAAEDMLGVFARLFLKQFPLETVAYAIPDSDISGGTQAFICRPITGGAKYSLHAYGTALDISWYRNPYIGLYQIPPGQPYVLATLIPPSSPLEFLYRDQPVADNNEQIKDIVIAAGFHQWGGDWHNPTDYMHFDTGQFTANLIAHTDFNTGQTIYRLGANYPDRINKLTDSSSWLKLYQVYQDSFAAAISVNIGLLATMSEYQFFDSINSYLQAAKKPVSAPNTATAPLQ
jgi:hypothetical protein